MLVKGSPVPVLEMHRISKSFAGVEALSDVSLTVGQGEVHGLLGHNGSGKSTLIKVLSGFHAPERGSSLRFNGQEIRLPLAAGEFRALGMAFVHQDLAIVESLTVVENLRIGALAAARGWHIDWKRQEREVRALLGEFEVDVDPWMNVADLRPWQRPLLAIIRAVDEMRRAISSEPGRPGLLILDEPTATLSGRGAQRLFSVVRQIARAGHGVLLVSHDLDEVLQHTDSVTVLRDGRVVGTRTTAKIDKGALVELIVGRELGNAVKSRPIMRAADSAVVKHAHGGAVLDVDFSMSQGEILGVTGLMGSGYDHIGQVLFGAIPGTGELILDGLRFDLRHMSPRAAIKAGISFVPAERLSEGCVAGLSANENLTLPAVGQFFHAGILRLSALHRHTGKEMGKLGVIPTEPQMALQAFSGGNQQKILLAKWLQMRPRLLLLQEPTQGVDVGARHQIHQLIRDYASQGTGIICASADHEQLEALCHRVLIFRKGVLVRELTGLEVTKENISAECLGGEQPFKANKVGHD